MRLFYTPETIRARPTASSKMRLELNLKILLHDYGRYPFTIELACELSQRGHEVTYAYSEIETVRGDFAAAACFPNLKLAPVRGAASLQKEAFVARYKAEVGHGKALRKIIAEIKPDVVLSGNAPLDAQKYIYAASRLHKAKFVYWMQDVLSFAIKRIVPKKLPVLGHPIAGRYSRLERLLVQRSDAVIAITSDFRGVLESWRVRGEKINIIENWAPALPTFDGDSVNAWKEAHGLSGKKIVMYSGTIGLKHMPELLMKLGTLLAADGRVQLVVIGAGEGMEWLRANSPGGIEFLPFQPFSELGNSLGAADALLVVLDRQASDLCVPSKTLTYFRAGKPVIAAMPETNPAAKIVQNERLGVVVEPEAIPELAKEIIALLSDEPRALAMGERARAYAEKNFDLSMVASKFEELLERVVSAETMRK
jgi:colanic acid biosynthesis glycosyl transferase WcaI